MLKLIFKAIKNPGTYFWRFVYKNPLLFKSDRFYIEAMWRQRMSYRLNINKPKSFNEKLQWLKLYYRNPEQTLMVDKYAVKEFVAERIGREYIIPTIGVWDKFDQIDFDMLPDQFVLKCTHDSGGLVICKDKRLLDVNQIKGKIERSLSNDFYMLGREWPYKYVQRKIIAEAFLVDVRYGDLRDYKFFCFNGIVHYFKIDFNRYTSHRANYYNRKGELQQFGEVLCPPDFEINLDIPNTLNKMIGLAEKLSFGIPFLRVDFYEVEGSIYFGELTFFPSAGIGPFIPEIWDIKLGELLELPQIN